MKLLLTALIAITLVFPAPLCAQWFPVLNSTYTVVSGGGTIALIDNEIASGPNGGDFATMDCTGANTIAVFLKWELSTPTGPTDDQGNTYTPVAGGSLNGTWYVAANATCDSTMVISIGGTGIYFSAVAFALSNVATSSPVDGSPTYASGANSPSGAGSITPSSNNDAVLSAIVFNNASTSISVDGGFTANSSGNGYQTGAVLIQTTAAAANPQWTWTGTTAAISSLVLKN